MSQIYVGENHLLSYLLIFTQRESLTYTVCQPLRHFRSVMPKTAFAAVSTGKAGTCFKANKQKTNTHPSPAEKKLIKKSNPKNVMKKI